MQNWWPYPPCCTWLMFLFLPVRVLTHGSSIVFKVLFKLRGYTVGRPRPFAATICTDWGSLKCELPMILILMLTSLLAAIILRNDEIQIQLFVAYPFNTERILNQLDKRMYDNSSDSSTRTACN